MKQLCNNCGRRFDAELTDGICPYCGRYLSLPQVEQAQQEHRKSEKQPEQQPEPRQKTKKERQREKARLEQEKKQQREEAVERLRKDQEQREQKRKEEEEKEKQKQAKKGQKKWTLCIVLLVILAIVQLVNFVNKKPEEQPEAEAQPENGITIQEKMYSLGDVIKAGPLEKEITLSQPQVMENIRGMSEQNKMVRVYCEAGKRERQAIHMNMEWFLEVDNKYYNAVSSYDMERVYPEMEKEMLEDDTLESAAMDAGWVYFVVPVDTTAGTLWIGERPLNEHYDIEGDILMRGTELEFTETGALK